ncbi:type II toxin-antitoxin system death-on-curing family toxin [Nocardia sp. NPDC050378]|uniref:type II toxin-antitoxin system death-on-curing family toxin n=1 Tax=Nocardia sp. NPDC050378 TaxID=3155400 RepID=UPI0033DBE25F
MIYLDLAEVVAIARAVNKTPHAVRDIGLLAGAVERPKATVFGQEAYPGLFLKAAALLHSIARNHALIDGDKRTAFVASVAMLRLNGYRVRPLPDEQEELMNRIATGDAEVAEIAQSLESWSDGIG